MMPKGAEGGAPDGGWDTAIVEGGLPSGSGAQPRCGGAAPVPRGFAEGFAPASASPSRSGGGGGGGGLADEGDVPLMIPAEATLVDGLRAILVHHLKRSVGSNVVSLSTSQAELLEHHLARLASYAQKIVHTLAFATRFLSKSQGEGGEHAEPPDPGGGYGGPGSAAGCGGGGQPGQMPLGGGYAQAGQEAPPQPRPNKKALKLSDDEILNIYKNAQAEAAIEADWRGIQGPARNGGGDWSAASSGRTSRSFTAASSGLPEGGGGGFGGHPGGAGGGLGVSDVPDAGGGDQEYLRIFSKALQEQGRSPRALAAELVDPSSGSACCRPAVQTMMHRADRMPRTPGQGRA